MSRSVSAPSSVTNTSPCWNGLIVPGSTFRYGSNFCTWTLRPRALRSRPSEAATMPFPRPETTPPGTNTYDVDPVAGELERDVLRRGGLEDEERAGRARPPEERRPRRAMNLPPCPGGEAAAVGLDGLDARPPVREVVRLGEEGPDVLARREE